MTSRSPAPDRFATSPGRSQAVCRSYCSKRTDGSRPAIPFGTRASPVTNCGGFQAQAHLIPVVLPGDRGAVQSGPDLHPQDHAVLGDRAGLLRGMRMRKAGRQHGGAGHRPGPSGGHRPVLAAQAALVTPFKPVPDLPGVAADDPGGAGAQVWTELA